MAKHAASFVLLVVLILCGGQARGEDEGPALTGARSVPARWDGATPTAHEWGTFTSVMGSSGAVLEGLMHEETDLPEFVHDLRDHAGVTGVSPKMETPVVYFYSADARRITLDVTFPRGTITQWYPAASRVNHVGPLTNGWPAAPSGRRITEHAGGHIRWGGIGGGDLLVMPRGATETPPAVGARDPWRFCREVDANLLRACTINAGATQAKRSRKVRFEYEKCLFYRGLGDFALPLDGEVRSERVTRDDYHVDLTLVNPQPKEPLAHVFLVWVKDGRCGFHYVPKLDDTVDLELTIPLMSLEQGTEILAEQMADRLVETGLFTDEALAMVHTWQQGYFRDEGLRALYVLPRAFVDRELPLEIRNRSSKDVTPWTVVRTFVGRTELLSPQRERALIAAVTDFAGGTEVERDAARAELARWGRFAVPYLNRVIAMATDPDIIATARRALDRLTLTR